MKFKHVVLLTMGIALVSGCTSNRELAEGGFGYLEVEEQPSLIIPEGLEQRAPRSQYQIPEETTAMRNAPVGANVSIRSPRQILTLAPGSRVDEGVQASVLAFDAVEGVSDLPAWIWDEVERVLAASGATLVEHDRESRAVTDSFRIQQYTRPRQGFFNRLRGRRVAVETEQTLIVDMTAPAHRRSATLSVNAQSISQYDDGRRVPQDQLPAMLQREIEADFLNTISSNLNRRYMQGRVAAVQTDLEFELLESPDGYPAVAFAGDFNTGWVIMPGIITDLGFVIDDLNQTEGTYYTEYQPGGKRGWFSRLFRRSVRGPLDLPRGTEVNFSVDEVNGIVYIVPMIDGNALDQAQLESWAPALEDAFRNLDQ